MPICLKCENEFPYRLKIDGKYRNLKNRKYCIDCSPFGIHNTKQLINSDSQYNCEKCGETDKNNFYGYKKKLCNKCHNNYVLKKGREKKQFARQILGNKCKICGYDKFEQALDIHHLNPSLKDINFKSMRGWSIERITQEIENCILLCKNCHIAVHCGLIKLD